MPAGHAASVAAAKRAEVVSKARWAELRALRLCLSSADIGLRSFRKNYRTGLVNGVPAREVPRMYQISRDDLQRCDRELGGIEGDGAIAAARYREMIAAILPSILVLRDYYGERDYLEDRFAKARAQHPAVMSGLEKLEEASISLRARATAVRAELAATLPAEPRDLSSELYFALLELDDQLSIGATAEAITTGLEKIEGIRTAARGVVADLAGSTKADHLDDVLQGASAVLRDIKNRVRKYEPGSSAPLGPSDLQRLEYDLFKRR